MKLTLHIVRKDLVRMRAWIACWVALLLAPIGVGVLFIRTDWFSGVNWDLSEVLAIVTGVEVLFGYLLTILVIQEDGVVGTREFWKTRPISGARLVVAKFISLIVVVGLVPVLVMLPWWRWCGFGVQQIAAASSETIMILILAMLPAAAVAVLTDSLARALLWTVGAIAVLFFAVFVFAFGPASGLPLASDQATFVWRVILAVAVGALGMILLVIARYLGRARGFAALVWCSLIVVMVGGAMRWPMGEMRVEPREQHAGVAAGVKVAFHRAVAEPLAKSRRLPLDGIPVQRIRTELVVSGVPADRVLLGLGAHQRWSWSGGPEITRRDYLFSDYAFGSMLGLRFGEEDPERLKQIAEHRETRTGRTFAPDESYAEPVTWLPPSFVDRMRKDPPHYEARLWWQIGRPEVALEIPLAPGPWVTRNGHGVGIESVRRDVDTFSISLIATRPVLIAPQVRLLLEPMQRDGIAEEQRWALLDRSNNRIVYTFGERHADKPRTIVVNGVRIERRVHTAVGPSVFLNGKWVRKPNWTMGTSLAVYRLHEEAVFSRSLEVPRYEITP